MLYVTLRWAGEGGVLRPLTNQFSFAVILTPKCHLLSKESSVRLQTRSFLTSSVLRSSPSRVSRSEFRLSSVCLTLTDLSQYAQYGQASALRGMAHWAVF